jgi:hypothetical protein
MKKGTPHPHHPPEKRVARWWVYQHPQPTKDNLTDAERAYKELRERIERTKNEMNTRLIRSFSFMMRDLKLEGRYLFEEQMSNVASLWFSQNVARFDLEFTESQIPPTPLTVLDGSRFIERCFADPADCKVQLFSSMHEGDDADDSELYFTVVNGIFPTNATEGVARVFLVDIARFGKARDGGPADTNKIVQLFLDEKPLTDEAWRVDREDPELREPLAADFTDVKLKDERKKITIQDYPPTINALFHFIFDHIDDPLGVRITEFVGFQDGKGGVSVLNTKTSVFHVVPLEEEADVGAIVTSQSTHDEN